MGNAGHLGQVRASRWTLYRETVKAEKSRENLDPPFSESFVKPQYLIKV